MYHPGKVLDVHLPSEKQIVSADNDVQATVEMWDENIFTFLVNQKLGKKIKAGDVVLVDYRYTDKPAPNHIIIKILKGEKGKRIWETYTGYYSKKREKDRGAKIPVPGHYG